MEESVFIWKQNGMWPMTGTRTRDSGSGLTVQAMLCGTTGICIRITGIILERISQWLGDFSLSRENRITLTGMGRWQSLGPVLWYRWTKTAYCIFRRRNPWSRPQPGEGYRRKMEQPGNRKEFLPAKQVEKRLR